MVVSLVNPHDVLLYPKNYIDRRATTTRGWRARSSLPATVDEDLSTKPTVQAQFLRIFKLSGPLPTPQMKRNYLNFYGNLMKASDAYLVKILDTLEEQRPARQHARHRDRRPRRDGHRPRRAAPEELQLLRGDDPRPAGLLEPAALPEARRRTDALVSHVDFLPTLASLVDAPSTRPRQLAGRRLLRPDPQPRRRGRRRTTPSSPTTTTSPARRAALPEAAEPHRQHPRAALQARPLLRRRRRGAATSGRCTT